MPTWLIVAIAIIYIVWSFIEIEGAITLSRLRKRGYRNAHYAILNKTITYLWLITTVLLICYWIWG